MSTTVGDIETRVRKAVGDTQSSATLTSAMVEAKVRAAVGDTQDSATLTAAMVEAEAREIVGDARATSTLTAAGIVARAREIINDQTSGAYRFSDVLMLQYVWDGVRELGNLRPLAGAITGSGTGALPVDNRWAGCLEQYVAFRCYMIDDSDTVNAKLGADCFALFTGLAKQTPYAATQAAIVGYVWEGIRELGNIRPLGVAGIAATVATGLSTSGVGSITIDDRWGGSLEHYVASRYYQADVGNPEGDKLALHHLKLFDTMARQVPYHCTAADMLKIVWEGVRELGNIRPLGVSDIAATVATGLAAGGAGVLSVDDRWSGCLEHYTMFRYYQSDHGNPESDKLAVYHFKLFELMARQTPYHLGQQDFLGYVWEGIERLWSVRPESRYVGMELVSASPPSAGGFVAAESIPCDRRWDSAIVEYACFKYFQRDESNGNAAKLAAEHLGLFTSWSAQ